MLVNVSRLPSVFMTRESSIGFGLGIVDSNGCNDNCNPFGGVKCVRSSHEPCTNRLVNLKWDETINRSVHEESFKLSKSSFKDGKSDAGAVALWTIQDYVCMYVCVSKYKM